MAGDASRPNAYMLSAKHGGNMANDSNLAAQVGTARSAMRRELGDAPHPAIYAFDGITMPLLAIADELRRIRELLERRDDA